jgi:tRNA-2-methylthio-N6-dimethylallyladenosine synthase
MKRYWLETYGCQMNKAESGSLELGLQASGWRPAGDLDEAELVILNTCSVRATAEERIWGRLGFFKAQKARAARRGRRLRVVLLGCMGERLKDELLARAPHVDVLAGTFQKHLLLEALEEEPRAEGAGGPSRGCSAALSLTGREPYRFAARHSPGRVGEVRAFLPIMHGCDNFCAYCIVPYVRGPEVSRDPRSILEELAQLKAAGVREITLLGQNVNSYRHGELDFTGLLERLLRELRELRELPELPQSPEPTWLRFLTSHPKDLSPRLAALLARGGALCRQLHLPVQHGSDRVLQAMGRGYTRGSYLELAQGLRKEVPELVLTTDILIGFPGETEEDFRLTLKLMEQVQFDDAFTYRYNPREGTRAFLLDDDVPGEVKQERLSEVIRLQRRISARRRRERLGRLVPVLVEAPSKRGGDLLARTEGDETVVFPGPPERIGHFTRVRLLELSGHTFRGEESA